MNTYSLLYFKNNFINILYFYLWAKIGDPALGEKKRTTIKKNKKTNKRKIIKTEKKKNSIKEDILGNFLK
jgi:hypothetical protein